MADPTWIAGHSFVETPSGRQCAACGKTWLAVLAEREHWKPGTQGIAHNGALTENECNQLHAEIERIWKALA